MSDARVRAQVVRIVDRRDETTILGRDGVTRRFGGDSAALVRAVLELHERPVTRDQLLAALRERAGGEVPTAPVDELLALLDKAGVLVPPALRPAPPLIRRVVLGISGAVSAVDSPALVRALQAMGCRVRAALTRTARRFVSPDALAAITHEKVYRGIWDLDETDRVPHVALAEWAELVLVAPASASALARLAGGEARDLISAIVVATRAPVVIAPSMNDTMWASPAVRRNVETLRGDGRFVIHPAWGVEVAHEPERRVPRVGPAPPAAAIADLVRSILAEIPAALPRDAAGWDALYRAPEALPWSTDALDEDLGAALGEAAAAGARRLLDLGTGAGTAAIAAARRGFEVVATDLSATALDLGRRRAGDLPVAWVLDDVTHTRLWGRFDVACDRGLLHCLGREAWPAYAEAVARLLAPGGRLLLKVHTAEDAALLGTAPPSEGDVRAIFGDAFTLRPPVPSSLPGPGGRAPRAVLYVLTRLP